MFSAVCQTSVPCLGNIIVAQSGKVEVRLDGTSGSWATLLRLGCGAFRSPSPFEPGDAGEGRNERPLAAEKKAAFVFCFAGLGHSRKPKMVSVESGFDASKLDCKLTGNKLGHREGSNKKLMSKRQSTVISEWPMCRYNTCDPAKAVVFSLGCMYIHGGAMQSGSQNRLSMRFITGQVVPAANKSTFEAGGTIHLSVGRGAAGQSDGIRSGLSCRNCAL